MLPTLLLATAAAQDSTDAVYGFDAHGFRFVSADADVRAPLRFWRPAAGASLGWSIGAMGEYASRPLVFESEAGDRFAASSNLAAVNVAAGFNPVASLRFDVSLPVVVTNTFGGAPDPFAGGYPTSGGGPTLGDLRINVLASPVRAGGGSDVGVGFLAALDLPTGDPERWVGTRGPAAVLGAVFSGEVDRLTLGAQAAARLAPNTRPDERPAPTIGGDAVEVQGSANFLVDPSVGLGVELGAAIPIDAQVRTALSVPAEAMVTTRWLSPSGGHVAAGVGVGLGSGAGASPFRVVVGGGFGAAVSTTPKDSDGDGLADRDEVCPLEPETANGYKDEDGCADGLPSLVIGAKLGEEKVADAVIEVTNAAGYVTSQTGTATQEGLPGERLHIEARQGACHVGRDDVTVPQEGQGVASVALKRTDGSVLLSVSDATGRPLEGAQVRYVIDEAGCKATDTSMQLGRGTHVMGTGPVKLFVTAMGYDVFQSTFTLAEGEQRLVEAKLSPTSVSLKDGKVKIAMGLAFAAGTGTLDARSASTTQQIASVLLSQDPVPKVEIAAWGDGKDAKKLSVLRAEAVRDALIAFGVPTELMVVTGKGALPKDQKEWVTLTVVPATP